MILSVFTGIAVCILSMALLFKRHAKDTNTIQNEELDKYYEMCDEPASVQLRQLMNACKLHMTQARKLAKRLTTAHELYDSKLLSSKYYNRMLKEEQDLHVSRILLETEAEILKPDQKDQFFAEASKLPEKKQEPPRKLFDEALYLKRRAVLLKGLECPASDKHSL